MELILALGAIAILDVLALRFGLDSHADLPHNEWRAIRSK